MPIQYVKRRLTIARAAPYSGGGRGDFVACTPFLRVYMTDVLLSVEQGKAAAIP